MITVACPSHERKAANYSRLRLATAAALALGACGLLGRAAVPDRSIVIGTRLSLSWHDCGGPEAVGRVAWVGASSVVVGESSFVPVSVSVSEPLPAEAVIVNATTWSQELQLMTLEGSVCTPSRGVLHLGRMYLGKLHYSGLACPLMEEGAGPWPRPLNFSVRMHLTPPFYAPPGFKTTLTNITASAPGRGQLFCATLTTHDPTDPASVKLLEQAQSSR